MILHDHQLYEILFHIHGVPSYGEERTENDVLSDFCHHYLYPSLCHLHLNSQDELIKMDYEVWILSLLLLNRGPQEEKRRPVSIS